MKFGCFERQIGFNLIFACFLVVIPHSLWSQEDQSRVNLRMTGGKQVSGVLKTIDSEAVAFVTGEGLPQVEGLGRIDRIEFNPEGIEPVPMKFEIELRDGSTLRARSLKISADQLSAKLGCGLDVETRTRLTRFVRLKTYENDLRLASQWRSILEDKQLATDVLIVNRTGELVAIEGLLGDLGADKIDFSIEARSANVALEKIEAFIFYQPATNALESAVCKAELVDGTILFLRSISWNEHQLIATSLSGIQLSIPSAQLRSLDFSTGRAVYLDDLQPTTNDWNPLIASAATVDSLRALNLARVNQSFSGKPLSLRLRKGSGLDQTMITTQFEHGFAMCGGGKLAFVVDRAYKQLVGTVGFDPEANENGNVLFSVRLDGKLVLESAIEKRNLVEPLNLNFDITNVDRVVLQVDYRDGRSVGDQIHLVDFKVSK